MKHVKVFASVSVMLGYLEILCKSVPQGWFKLFGTSLPTGFGEGLFGTVHSCNLWGNLSLWFDICLAWFPGRLLL